MLGTIPGLQHQQQQWTHSSVKPHASPRRSRSHLILPMPSHPFVCPALHYSSLLGWSTLFYQSHHFGIRPSHPGSVLGTECHLITCLLHAHTENYVIFPLSLFHEATPTYNYALPRSTYIITADTPTQPHVILYQPPHSGWNITSATPFSSPVLPYGSAPGHWQHPTHVHLLLLLLAPDTLHQLPPPPSFSDCSFFTLFISSTPPFPSSGSLDTMQQQLTPVCPIFYPPLFLYNQLLLPSMLLICYYVTMNCTVLYSLLFSTVDNSTTVAHLCFSAING